MIYVYACTIERHGRSVGALVQGRGFDSLSEGLKAVFFAAACSWFGLKKYMSQNLNVTLPYFPCKLTKCKCQMFTSIKGLKKCWMFLRLAIENYWWRTFVYKVCLSNDIFLYFILFYFILFNWYLIPPICSNLYRQVLMLRYY